MMVMAINTAAISQPTAIQKPPSTIQRILRRRETGDMPADPQIAITTLLQPSIGRVSLYRCAPCSILGRQAHCARTVSRSNRACLVGEEHPVPPVGRACGQCSGGSATIEAAIDTLLRMAAELPRCGAVIKRAVRSEQAKGFVHARSSFARIVK